MGYDVSWKIDKRVIVCMLSDKLTKEEVVLTNDKLRNYVAEGEKPVHTILDLSTLDSFPMDIRLLNTTFPFHGAEGWILLVGANAIMNYVSNVVVKMSGSKLKRFETRESAYKFLAEEDTTLQSELES